MTKREIVEQIAKEIGISRKDVFIIIQLFFDKIMDALVAGETIELRDFGVFKVKQRKARLGRNPRSGESVQVPYRRVAIFKPGLILKKRLRAQG